MGRQIIDLSKNKPGKGNNVVNKYTSYAKRHNSPIDTYEDSIELIKKIYPDKLLFSIKETSKIIGVSYDFIREKCITGAIPFKKFGNRRMIHLLEVARLVKEGIE